MRKPLNKVEKFLLYLLPVVVFFSYHPVISLGANESMNFELSLPLIWLALFGVVTIISYWKNRKKLRYKLTLHSVALCALPFFGILSILWTLNPTRGILTAGILFLIFISASNILISTFDKQLLQRLLCIYLISATVIGLICILQCFLDVFGFVRDDTLLCYGCTYFTLGFPHSSGFAIEPQFMGNLLIMPALIALGLLYKNIITHNGNSKLFGFGCLSIFYIMVLYVCFSRGAIYAFVAAAILLGVIFLIRDRKAWAFILATPVILGFGVGLLLQGLLAEISPTVENFNQGIQRSIHQISLGLIDIREPIELDGENSTFSGYIEESTTIRLNLNKYAVQAWQTSPVWGVGIGGAGVALNRISDNALSSKEIIQNEYLTILAELGIVGILLLLFFAWAVIKALPKKEIFKNPLLLATIVAFLITFGFFSGLPNVLHIYLVTPLLYQIGAKRLL